MRADLVLLAAGALATALAAPPSARAQGAAAPPPAAKPQMTEACPGLVAGRAPWRSLVQRVALNADQVRDQMAKIRARTKNQKSLDDVMRYLLENYANKGVGFSDDGFLAAIEAR